MPQILTGLSNYTHPDLKGTFYPTVIKREEYLEFYAKTFKTIELGFTFSQMPNSEQLGNISKRALIDISIQAHESLTHKIDQGTWRNDVHAFREALEPLQRSDQLEAVLLQFFFNFKYEPERRIYLSRHLKELKEIPVVVEFLNDGWQKESVYEGLRKLNVCYCMSDMPAANDVPKPIDTMTADHVYIRFHGRNRLGWYNKDDEERYDYLYTDQELGPWVWKIKGKLAAFRTIRIYFLNSRKGKAALNSKMMRLLSAK
jgi:uncharacterized protein YecE (DUF72 family)